MADTLMDDPETNEEGSAGSTDKEGGSEAKADKSDNSKPDDSKPDDLKAEDKSDKPKADNKAPDKYELKPGEGKTFDPKFIEAYEGVAKELGLSNESAQTIIDKMAPVLEAQQQQILKTAVEGWIASSNTDKEFGGEKIKENLAIAHEALKQFGNPELKDFINSTGLGNHPEVIRFFYRVGKSLNSDGFVKGNTGEGKGKTGPKTFREVANSLYPSERK